MKVSRGDGSSPQNSLRNGQPLHVAGTFVNAADFGVTIKFLGGAILGDADAPVDFDCLGGSAFGDLQTLAKQVAKLNARIRRTRKLSKRAIARTRQLRREAAACQRKVAA